MYIIHSRQIPQGCYGPWDDLQQRCTGMRPQEEGSEQIQPQGNIGSSGGMCMYMHAPGGGGLLGGLRGGVGWGSWSEYPQCPTPTGPRGPW